MVSSKSITKSHSLTKYYKVSQKNSSLMRLSNIVLSANFSYIWVTLNFQVPEERLSRNRTHCQGLDNFDEEAKCYSRLFEFCQVTFCHLGRVTFGKVLACFSSLLSILPQQNNLVAAVTCSVPLPNWKPK